jgi:hypothetical protein
MGVTRPAIGYPQALVASDRVKYAGIYRYMQAVLGWGMCKRYNSESCGPRGPHGPASRDPDGPGGPGGPDDLPMYLLHVV